MKNQFSKRTVIGVVLMVFSLMANAQTFIEIADYYIWNALKVLQSQLFIQLLIQYSRLQLLVMNIFYTFLLIWNSL